MLILFRTPDYFKPMVEPPIVNLMGGLHVPFGVMLLLCALGWQLLGGYFIYRIINIRV